MNPFLPQSLQVLYDSPRFQGWGKTKNYFEGWFFKLVSASGEFAGSIIPGIFYSANGGEGSHSFIQVMDGVDQKCYYHRFDVRDFKPHKDRFAVQVGESFFSDSTIEMNTGEDDGIQGKLEFHNLRPWPVGLFSPGIMGWYRFMPFMECYHGLVSMDHTLSGSLNWYGRTVDLNGGRGYIEKDWGRSFPGAWVWVQSNHFELPGVSLSASVAKIPWLRHYFRGFIMGLLYDGTIHRFATYTGAKLRRFIVSERNVEMVVESGSSSKKKTLSILIERGRTVALYSPHGGSDMQPKTMESLDAAVNVQLKQGNITIFEGYGKHAGLDVNGNIEEIS